MQKAKPTQAVIDQNLGLGRLGQAAWLGLAWLAFFEVQTSRPSRPAWVDPKPSKPSKPTQARIVDLKAFERFEPCREAL